MSSILKPCPCGKTPTELSIDEGSTYRWRIISGNCCGEWMIESSRIDYQATDAEILKECTEDWNNATRSESANKDADFRCGAKTMFDYVLYATANNWHCNPEINKQCEEENEFANKLIADALAEVLPEDEINWKSIVELQKEINRLTAQNKELVKVTDMLLKAKDYKELVGKDDAYETMKNLAWANLRAIVAKVKG